MVNIIDTCFRVNKLDQVLDNLNDIFLGQHTNTWVCVQTKLVVNTIATYFTEIITLLAEEEVENDFLSAGIIHGICITQLLVDVADGLLLAICSILLESVEDDAIVGRLCIFLMNEDRRHIACHNLFDGIFVKHTLAFENDLVTLDRYNFTCILINEVLNPALEHTCCKLLAEMFLQILASSLNFLCKVEDLENVFIILETDGTKQSRYGQFLLTVDVRVHYIINVRSELDPTALEGNDTGRIEQRAISMHTAAEEDTG